MGEQGRYEYKLLTSLLAALSARRVGKTRVLVPRYDSKTPDRIEPKPYHI